MKRYKTQKEMDAYFAGLLTLCLLQGGIQCFAQGGLITYVGLVLMGGSFVMGWRWSTVKIKDDESKDEPFINWDNDPYEDE